MAHSYHETEHDGKDIKEIYHEVVRDSAADVEGKGASTGSDVGDMYRMGKEQQFKVRSPQYAEADHSSVLAHILPVDHDMLHLDDPGYLGNHPHVSDPVPRYMNDTHLPPVLIPAD